MMRTLLSALILACILSCSTSKQIEKSLSSGNYDQAIYDLIEAGVIGEEEYLDDDCSGEVCSEYEFGDVEDDDKEYCF